MLVNFILVTFFIFDFTNGLEKCNKTELNYNFQIGLEAWIETDKIVSCVNYF
jgi:hypothetical protein